MEKSLPVVLFFVVVVFVCCLPSYFFCGAVAVFFLGELLFCTSQEKNFCIVSGISGSGKKGFIIGI